MCFCTSQLHLKHKHIMCCVIIGGFVVCVCVCSGVGMASTLVEGPVNHDYEIQEDWEDESQTPPTEPYPYSYPTPSKGGSSDEDDDNDDDEPHYEPVSHFI